MTLDDALCVWKEAKVKLKDKQIEGNYEKDNVNVWIWKCLFKPWNEQVFWL